MVDDDGIYGTGKGFGAECEELFRAGRYDLPLLAVDYARTARELQWAAMGDTSAFTNNDGSVAAANRRWTEMMENLQDAFVETSDTVVEVGDGLCSIADRYARGDAEAREEFERLQLEDFAEDYAQVPPPVPDAPEASEGYQPSEYDRQAAHQN